MTKTILRIGKYKQLREFNLTTWESGSTLTLDELPIREDPNKGRVERIIGSTSDGRVLYRTVRETNRG
jgi:hypothetical protein